MYLVGIAGGSGSGKTTFAKKIVARVERARGAEGASGVAILHQDAYYLPAPAETLRAPGGGFNFDHPEAFDWPLLKDQLGRLQAGERVATPVYDYTRSRRAPETLDVGPCHTILFEGLFTLWDPEMRDIFDTRVFLHVDADIRFIRRLHRDVRERGRSVDSIIRQYYDTVRPMHHEFLDRTRQHADLLVGEETDIAADVVAARVIQLAGRTRS